MPTFKDTVRLSDKKGVKMIAHRGLSGLELENTNAAFVAAGQRSFYGIETDTQRTKDGHFIAFHDGELDRMMGVSIKICDITLEELRKYQMKDFWEKRKRSDLIVPTLDEYIRICAQDGNTELTALLLQAKGSAGRVEEEFEL